METKKIRLSIHHHTEKIMNWPSSYSSSSNLVQCGLPPAPGRHVSRFRTSFLQIGPVDPVPERHISRVSTTKNMSCHVYHYKRPCQFVAWPHCFCSCSKQSLLYCPMKSLKLNHAYDLWATIWPNSAPEINLCQILPQLSCNVDRWFQCQIYTFPASWLL